MKYEQLTVPSPESVPFDLPAIQKLIRSNKVNLLLLESQAINAAACTFVLGLRDHKESS